MFDHTDIHHHSHSSSIHKTVHEHRAPTDASVALLKEMETAAQNKVDRSISVGNNGLEAVIHVIQDHMSDSTRFVCHFTLNGRKMKYETSIRSIDLTQEKVGEALVKGISETIAVEVLEKAFPRELLGRLMAT